MTVSKRPVCIPWETLTVIANGSTLEYGDDDEDAAENSVESYRRPDGPLDNPLRKYAQVEEEE